MKKTSHKNPIETSIKKEVSDNNISEVLVALSGGADSVATTLALQNCNLKITALHCNFHLRGAESDRDMNFVKDFCKNHGIPLEINEYNVEEYISLHKGTSLEMACRDLRHEWFRTKLKETGADRIVTGHNADDNIETFFLNLLRGSGTRGLKSMTADNGIIWRPLLKFHRNEIINYLKEKDQLYIIDSTNLKSDYRRNYLRNEIIPLFRKEWKGFDKSIDKTIQNLEEENRLVESYLKPFLDIKKGYLDVNEILSFPSPLLLIKRFIDPYGPFTTTPKEILSAINAAKPHIRRWELKGGLVILRGGKLFVEMSHGERCS